MVFLVVAGFAIFLVIQVSSLVKSKLYKEMLVCIVITTFALIYAVSGVTEWDFPAPGKLAEIVFYSISHIVFPNQ